MNFKRVFSILQWLLLIYVFIQNNYLMCYVQELSNSHNSVVTVVHQHDSWIRNICQRLDFMSKYSKIEYR